MTNKPPIREDMFVRPGVLSTIWAKFFSKLGSDLGSAEDNISDIEDDIEGISTGSEEKAIALETKVNTINSTTTITTTPDSESILTLYWMGV